MNLENSQSIGLYNPNNEHDACGIAALVNIRGIASYKIICDALEILMNLEHRGGAGAEENSGDGAGILIQIPHDFFMTQELGFKLPKKGHYAIAQMFLSPNKDAKEQAKAIFLQGLKDKKLEFLGFREVPFNPSDIGASALKPCLIFCKLL